MAEWAGTVVGRFRARIRRKWIVRLVTWRAKNIVAAGLADRAEVQLAYAIGVAEPVSIMVNTFGTGKVDDARLAEIVRENFSLTPAGMIKSLNLRRPIYQKTAAFGHFGRDGESFTWEATDKAKVLREAAQLTTVA